jgi:hypothetical protein
MRKPTFLGPLIGKGAGHYELVNADDSVLASHVEPAFDSTSRRRGLLGRDAVPEHYALIIAPCSGIHTFFMRFPIDAVFVSRDGTVIKTCAGVKPWRIALAVRAFAVIEAASGFIDRTETIPGDVVKLREIPHTRRATDTLQPLATAPAAVAGGSSPYQAVAPKRITLADVIAHKTPLGWFESVAIVQELCEVVLARGPADDPRVPELKHIALMPDGGIELLAEGPAEHSPVHRASLVLLALTPETQLPVQLRLLALEQVSPRPRLETLKDLHTELEFFERPDRRAIVRGVSERFRHASAAALAAAGGVVPTSLLEPPPPRRRRSWWARKRVWVGLALVLMTAGAASALWVWQRPDGPWMRSAVSQAARAATATVQTVAQAAREQLNVVERKLGVNRRRPTPELPVRTDLKAVTRSGSPAGTPPSASRPAAPVEPSAPMPPSLPREVAAEPQAAGSSQPVVAAPPSSEAPDRETRLVPSQAVVYSSADPLVMPPVRIRPATLRAAPSGVRADDVAEVEMVVSPTGEVETARLLAAGPGPQPAMMLSAIKAWRFQPATRGGQPVRYRLRLRLPTN